MNFTSSFIYVILLSRKGDLPIQQFKQKKSFVFEAILCYISALGVATMAGQLIVTLGIAVTAVAFVVLATKEMGPVIDNRAIAHHQA